MMSITGPIEFEWDAGNSTKNTIKHCVSQQESEEVFSNEPLLLMPDYAHSLKEVRYLLLGMTSAHRKLAIIFTTRFGRIRVISARNMSLKERKLYAKEAKTHTRI